MAEVPKIFTAAAAGPTPAPETSTALQPRVRPWLLKCFGEMIAGDREERNNRFLEEALELVQSCGCGQAEAHALVDYVFNRPAGDPPQEVGGVMITLAALCLANGMDMHAAGEAELARISVPETVARIRAKQAAKPRVSPLPGVYPERSARATDEVPTVVFLFREGAADPEHLVFGERVRLLFVDENCPGDRVYEVLGRDDPSRLAALVPDGGPIGNQNDVRHRGVAARVSQALDRKPRLSVVGAERPLNVHEQTPRFDKLNKDEWRDVVRRVRADLSDEEYDRLWDELKTEKAARAKNRSLS